MVLPLGLDDIQVTILCYLILRKYSHILYVVGPLSPSELDLMGGRGAATMAGEYVMLLRALVNRTHVSDSWSCLVIEYLRHCVLLLPSLLVTLDEVAHDYGLLSEDQLAQYWFYISQPFLSFLTVLCLGLFMVLLLH